MLTGNGRGAIRTTQSGIGSFKMKSASDRMVDLLRAGYRWNRAVEIVKAERAAEAKKKKAV